MYMHIRVSLVVGFILWCVKISYIFVLEIYIECQIMALFKDLSFMFAVLAPLKASLDYKPLLITSP